MGAGTAKPVQGPETKLESFRARYSIPIPANNGANYKAGDHTHDPESYTQKGLGNVWPDCMAYALQPDEQAYLGVYGQNLLTDNRVQEPSNQRSSSGHGQSTYDYLSTSTSVNVIPQTRAAFEAASEAAELRAREEWCKQFEQPEKEINESLKRWKLRWKEREENLDNYTNNAQHTQANKKDKTMPEPDSTTVPDLRPDVLKWWAKQLPGIPGNNEDWKLLSRGQLDDILACCAELRKKVEKVQEELEKEMEKEKKRRNNGEEKKWRLRIRYRLPDGTSGIMTMSKFWALFANKLRALDEREEELKKLREEKEKEEEKENLDTNTNTNNAQHTQANKKDEMVPEPDSATVLDSWPKGRIPPLYAARVRVLKERTKRLDWWMKEDYRTLSRYPTLYYEINCLICTAIFSAIWPDYAGFWPELYAHIIGCSSCDASSDLDASISNDTHCLRHGQAIHENGETPEPDSTTVPYPGHLCFSPEQRHALFDLLDKLEKGLKEEKEMKDWLLKEFKNVDPYEEEEEEEEGDTDGSSSYGSSSDFDESSDSDTDSLGHGQAVQESRETPKPNSTTVPDPGRFQVTRKQILFFRCLNELETRLKQEKELKKLKKAEMEEEKEEEEDEEDEDEDDEEEEDEDEEDEDREDTDGSSSYGSSSELDSPGHGQAITPKPDSTTVPDPRTAEHECCETIPDANVVGTSMTFPDKFIPAKTPPAWILDWLRPLNKMFELLTEVEEEVKAFELKKEEGEVEEEEEIRCANRVRLLNEMGKKFKEGLDEVWEYMEKEGFMGRVISWDEYMLMKKKRKEGEEEEKKKKEEEEEEEEEKEEEKEEEEEEEEDEEEQQEEGEEEEWKDPDGSSSCGASSDLNDMEVSSSDKDSPGHGQAITPKPDSSTVPDPTTAEQPYRITFFSTTLTFPDINAARAWIASERIRLEKEEASLDRVAGFLEEEKKELEELKKKLEEERGRYGSYSYVQVASSDLNDMEISSSDKVSPAPGQEIQEPRETREPELDAVMALVSDATEPTSRDSVTSALPPGKLIRRKTKDVDPKKCNILAFLEKEEKPTMHSQVVRWLTTTTKDDTTEVITITELPADSGNLDSSNETSAGLEEDWGSWIPNPWVEKIAYHHKMSGWTYHHPSPAWSFDHYPQMGWTYYDPLPTWSYYDPSVADKVHYYYPSPHLSVHHPTQTWYYYDDAMGWTYCDHVRAWEYLHPEPYAPHVCPGNSPDWTYYRSFTGPTAMI